MKDAPAQLLITEQFLFQIKNTRQYVFVILMLTKFGTVNGRMLLWLI